MNLLYFIKFFELNVEYFFYVKFFLSVMRVVLSVFKVVLAIFQISRNKNCFLYKIYILSFMFILFLFFVLFRFFIDILLSYSAIFNLMCVGECKYIFE